jgi:hypothetical protein
MRRYASVAKLAKWPAKSGTKFPMMVFHGLAIRMTTPALWELPPGDMYSF